MTEFLIKHIYPPMQHILGKKNYLKWIFRKVHGYPLDMENPRSLSEKIHWIKANCDLEPLSQFIDKYSVKRFVKERIGERYLAPLIGVYDRFDDIDIDSLPGRFVMKVTHGCGWNILVKDKICVDWKGTRAKINRWLRSNYYDVHGESCYRNLKGRIIVEEYLEDPSGSLKDYKFYCCNGEPLGLHVDSDRFGDHTYRIYDAEWNEFVKKKRCRKIPPDVPKPDKLEELLEVCRKLSNGFSFVRVDLYYTGGRIYFGELTFTPGNGMAPFDPVESDYYFGAPLDVRQYIVVRKCDQNGDI
jgi:hypothetical protein